MQEVMVSVLCLVYNHEPYLRRCLDSLVSQKTNFRYEVLVHDDASTDRSAAIIREYAEQYPDIIRPIYQTENQYSKRLSIAFTYMYPAAKGRYFAPCEGDDYWIDQTKLQQQFDAMEAHPDCTLCVHRVQGVEVDETPNGKMFPPIPPTEPIIKGTDLIHGILTGASYPFQTSSYFYRAQYYCPVTEKLDFMRGVYSGDVARLLYLGHYGNILYLDKTMSCYRMNSAGSWSASMKSNLAFRVRSQQNFIAFLQRYDVFTEGAYHDWIAADIHQREFRVLKIQYDVKAIKAPEYRALYRRLSWKERMAYSLVQYLPFTKKAIHALREKMNS